MIDLVMWGARFLLLGAALVAVGHVLVRLMHRQEAPCVAPAILVIAGAGAGFLVQAAALTGTARGAFDPIILGLLWQTGQGTGLVLHLSGAVVLMCGATLNIRVLQVVGAAVIVGAFLVIGHVADQPGLALRLALATHLALAAYWIGVLWPLFQLAGHDTRAAAVLGRDFGRIAMATVPMVVAIGVVMAIALLDRIDQLWTSVYGAALLAKIAAVAAMLALGAANKLRHVPALEAERTGAARALRLSLLCEGCFALAVVGATAAFSTVAGLP